MAQSLLGLKTAWEKAQAKKGGARPTTDEVIAAFEGIEFPTAEHDRVRWRSATATRASRDTAYRHLSASTRRRASPRSSTSCAIRAECVNPPADVNSVAWLEGGMKGAKCD